MLIDFFLEKRSPLINFQEKKHSMGNRYTDPSFGPLIQTVSLMLRRTKPNSISSLQSRTLISVERLTVYYINLIYSRLILFIVGL